MDILTPRGMRDFSVQETFFRDSIFQLLQKHFVCYGFLPLDTPQVERYDILSAKFAAGEGSDVMKEIFKFKDRGGRQLGLRFDLTVPLSRYVAMHPELKFPFKRSQIGRVYRDGPIRLGRVREFYQCDCDTVGSSSMLCEAELICLAIDVFSSLGLSARIEVNNRKLMNALLDSFGIAKKEEAIIIIDKLKKLSPKEFRGELSSIGISGSTADEILSLFSTATLPQLKKMNINQEGVKELEELFSYLDSSVRRKVKLNLSLARGLAYYTGTVFEGFLTKGEMTSSVCGGGRYDNMIGLYAGKGAVSAVGISFGVEPIITVLSKKQKTQLNLPLVYIVPIHTQKKSFFIAQKLRDCGISTSIDLIGRGVSKNLDYAHKMNIPYVVFVGEKEISSKKYKLRDMQSGKERLLSLESLGSFLKKK
ncbi:histidine--tRNA ligase [Candidatus Woesearchaeota archaeon]|nr:histidine--tRNA ligase [Candidatus Woesearchaeota archaeon]